MESSHHSMMKLAVIKKLLGENEETSNLPKIISIPDVFHCRPNGEGLEEGDGHG